MVISKSPGYVVTSLGARVQVEKSCFYDVAGTGVSPVLFSRADMVPSFVDDENNFVEGGWTCDSVSDSLSESETCVELGHGSSVCLAPNANLSINW